jgi:hypothetical protein
MGELQMADQQTTKATRTTRQDVAQSQKDKKTSKPKRSDAPAGEELTAEGTPGLTLTGGSGHA